MLEWFWYGENATKLVELKVSLNCHSIVCALVICALVRVFLAGKHPLLPVAGAPHLLVRC